MGRQSPRGRKSRRAFLLAPFATVIGAGIVFTARHFGIAPFASENGDTATLLPSRAAAPSEVTWAPGNRLNSMVSAGTYALPVGSGWRESILRLVAPEPGIDRVAWLERLAAAGAAPDLVSGLLSCDVRRVPIASKVTDLVRRDHLQTDQFDARAYRALEAGGELWGLPYAWTGAEIGIALDRSRFPRVGIPVGDAQSPTDIQRQAIGWSWGEFAEAMAVAAADGRASGSIPLERFGTIRSLPAAWRARWSDERGRIALDDREAIMEALRRFDTLRRDIGTAGRRTEASPTPVPRKGVPTAPAVPTPGIMRGPASVALGVGGRGLMRSGRAWAASIEVEQAPEFSASLLMPLPRGAVSVADVEPIVATISARPDRRDTAWRLMRWLVEEGRLASVERLVPAWRAAQTRVVAELAQASGAPVGRPDPIGKLFASVVSPRSMPRDGETRPSTPAPLPQPSSPVEALILGAIRRAPPHDPVLDGPAGSEARPAIGAGLRAWEAGEMAASDALDVLGPTLQAILDRTPGVLPE